MIDIKDIYWIAGLLEGEGFFGLRRGKDLVIQLVMTDKDVVERCRAILGFGAARERSLPSGKIAYRLLIANQGQAAGLMMTLLPLMGERRAAKIRHCIELWKTKPLRKSMWTHCKNGHELTPENTRIVVEGKYEKRRCKKCVVIRQRKYEAALRRKAAELGG